MREWEDSFLASYISMVGYLYFTSKIMLSVILKVSANLAQVRGKEKRKNGEVCLLKYQQYKGIWHEMRGESLGLRNLEWVLNGEDIRKLEAKELCLVIYSCT